MNTSCLHHCCYLHSFSISCKVCLFVVFKHFSQHFLYFCKRKKKTPSYSAAHFFEPGYIFNNYTVFFFLHCKFALCFPFLVFLFYILYFCENLYPPVTLVLKHVNFPSMGNKGYFCVCNIAQRSIKKCLLNLTSE